MKTLARFAFAFILVAGLMLPTLSRADDISTADQQTIKSLIQGQLDAFQHDDGATAYGFASPAIRDLFPSPDLFMQMVRNGYPPVYRPQSVTFGQVKDTPAGPLQKVFLTGPDGKSYVAVYSMQKQPDGTWKINGCTLVEDKGATI